MQVQVYVECIGKYILSPTEMYCIWTGYKTLEYSSACGRAAERCQVKPKNMSNKMAPVPAISMRDRESDYNILIESASGVNDGVADQDSCQACRNHYE